MGGTSGTLGQVRNYNALNNQTYLSRPQSGIRIHRNIFNLLLFATVAIFNMTVPAVTSMKEEQAIAVRFSYLAVPKRGDGIAQSVQLLGREM